MALTQVQGGMILPSTTLTTPVVATTMGVGGATPAASGSGITFPATQSASTDANTLDDYEEGTFTPTFASSGGSITTYNSNGYYIKVGKLVFVQLYCNVTSVGSASGTLNFAGLPFGVNGAFGANQGQVAALLRESNMTGTTYYSYMPGGNSTSGYITSLSSGGITWSSNGIWPLTFTYYTSA